MNKKYLDNFLFNPDLCRFIPDARAAAISPGLTSRWASASIGFLDHHFLLSELTHAGGCTEAQALEHLDEIASSANRQIKIFRMAVPAHCGAVAEVAISAEVGTSLFELIAPKTFPEISKPIFYLDHPLSPADYELGSCTISNPTSMVATLREAVQAAKEKRFGKIDLQLESCLHRQSVNESAALRRAVLAAAEMKR